MPALKDLASLHIYTREDSSVPSLLVNAKSYKLSLTGSYLCHYDSSPLLLMYNKNHFSHDILIHGIPFFNK